MVNLAQKLKCCENIQSIPGIGEFTEAMLIIKIAVITRFKSNKQVHTYVGIDFKRYQYGITHFRGTMNKRGNKKFIQFLFWIVINFIRGLRNYDNHVVYY
nr:transposase [Staphylococcus borealis]